MLQPRVAWKQSEWALGNSCHSLCLAPALAWHGAAWPCAVVKGSGVAPLLHDGWKISLTNMETWFEEQRHRDKQTVSAVLASYTGTLMKFSILVNLNLYVEHHMVSLVKC